MNAKSTITDQRREIQARRKANIDSERRESTVKRKQLPGQEITFNVTLHLIFSWS